MLTCGVDCCTTVWSDPFFFAKVTETFSSYLDMLENFAYPQLASRILPATRLTTTLEIDWARISYSAFPRLKGLPARSPDITPCDLFFQWGCVKDCVHRTPVADINDLKDRIAAAIATLICCSVHGWSLTSSGERVTNDAHVFLWRFYSRVKSIYTLHPVCQKNSFQKIMQNRGGPECLTNPGQCQR